MKEDAFGRLIDWANSQIDHYVMTGYILKEVHQVEPDRMNLILAEYHQKEPIAQVSVSLENNRFRGAFSLLADKEGPAPLRQLLETSDLEAALDWLRTGHDPDESKT
ncbi:hypothetical protein [Spirosoma gilvum]